MWIVHLPLQQDSGSCNVVQASLKRKWEEVGEEKTEAIKAHVKVDLDMKEQEELAKTDAKTQVWWQQCDWNACCTSPRWLPSPQSVLKDTDWFLDGMYACITHCGYYSSLRSAISSIDYDKSAAQWCLPLSADCQHSMIGMVLSVPLPLSATRRRLFIAMQV